jgi:23S rRNA (cytosine1962-C5)-methyltransferase
VLVIYEDEHLLVVNKPSGINTHKPDRFAPDGVHEWLLKRRPGLSIMHRLDKDTSGVLVFGRTQRANQSLARQFESHTIGKEYLLLSSARPSRGKFQARTAGTITEFEFVQPHGQFFLVTARPVTGKTHQIRRHAADCGFPILGDTKYGGEPAPRLMLHARAIMFEHPQTHETLRLEASVPAAFDEIDPVVAAKEFRDALFDEDTDSFRLISGAADESPDVVVDSYAGNLLVQWQTEGVKQRGATLVDALRERCGPRTIYEQLVTKQKRTTPTYVWGELTPERFAIRECGLTFLVGFREGLSTGIFLDQRENRWRLLTMKLATKTLLNCFSYTCAFSVAAAKAGATTASIDLSKNYLAWGQENFRANGLEPAVHSFLVGDVFEWLRRFEKRQQRWDIIILDPPTFSTTKKGRSFRAARDYQELEELAMRVLAPGGTLLCSTNQRTFAADEFEATLRAAAKRCGRVIASLEFETLPFDFRLAEGERSYLKTLWACLE